MNIEIADRLVKMRKKKGYSQEELAEKLGLSRQAVSKWERAEASPDTDNLICLAKLYGVSLDDLLNTDDDVDTIVEEQVKPEQEEKKEDSSSGSADDETSSAQKEESGDKSEEQEKKKDEAYIGKDGIHVSTEEGEKVHFSEKGIFVNDECKINSECKCYHEAQRAIPEGIVIGTLSLLALVAYILLGSLCGMWYNMWILFFVPEIIGSIIRAIRTRRFCSFDISVTACFAYFFVCMVIPGLSTGLWHPLWVIFLAIPIWYTVFGPVDKAIHRARVAKGLESFTKDDAIDNDEDDKDDEEDDE